MSQERQEYKSGCYQGLDELQRILAGSKKERDRFREHVRSCCECQENLREDRDYLIPFAHKGLAVPNEPGESW